MSNSGRRVNFEPLKYLKLVYCGMRGKPDKMGKKRSNVPTEQHYTEHAHTRVEWRSWR